MKIDIEPWNVPDEVRFRVPPQNRELGFSPHPSFKLEYVDADTLSALCDAFREEVFKKAKKDDPRRAHVNSEMHWNR